MTPCSNCGGIPYALGRCRPCYRWWLKYGKERPEALVIRLERLRFIAVLSREQAS